MRVGMLLTVLIASGCPAGSEQTQRDDAQSSKPESANDVAAAPVAVVPEPPPPIPFDPLTLTVRQRSTTALPIPNAQVQLTVDDITRGQVMASLALGDGTPLHAPVSMQAGDALPFTIEGRSFLVKLTALNNQLVGDDSAQFVLKAVGDESSALSPHPLERALTESERIERLIEAVAAEQGAVFLRNGREYTSSEAADHLRMKWQAAGDRIKTADDFIEQLASRSSLSGEAYVIRVAAGGERPAAEFLREKLRDLESTSPE